MASNLHVKRSDAIAAAAAAAVVAGAALSAEAAYEDCASRFRVINAGSTTMTSIFMRPSGGIWGPDLLGNDVLDPGYNYRALAGLSLGSEVQDIIVYYEDGVHSWIYGIDVCYYNATFYH